MFVKRAVKMAGNNRTVLCNFGLSALFTSIMNNVSVAAGCSLQTQMLAYVVMITYYMTRGNFCLVCPLYKDLLSESSLHGARIFLMLGSSYLSAMQILAVLRRS